jgi:hypothetical protein
VAAWQVEIADAQKVKGLARLEGHGFMTFRWLWLAAIDVASIRIWLRDPVPSSGKE